MSPLLEATRAERIAARKKRNQLDKISSIAMPLIGIGCLLAVWQVFILINKVPAWQLSPPVNVFRSMIMDFKEVYMQHVFRTFLSIMVGWGCACMVGVTFAALMCNYPILNSMLTPYINFLCTLPVITLVPMMYVFMGVGEDVIIIAIILQSFAIVCLNSSTGLLNVPVLRKEMMVSLRANKKQIFFQCNLPSALSNVFTGMKLSAIFATTTCVSAEVNGSAVGLGALVITAKAYSRTEQMCGAIIFIAVIGVFFYMLTDIIEAVFIRWKD
ncbi:MAG: ABC transporter permease subunit [Lachnospiraceae bacterium]|nr:ABC transporter permease subunit [Lachnospiraceae bacterium]